MCGEIASQLSPNTLQVWKYPYLVFSYQNISYFFYAVHSSPLWRSIISQKFDIHGWRNEALKVCFSLCTFSLQSFRTLRNFLSKPLSCSVLPSWNSQHLDKFPIICGQKNGNKRCYISSWIFLRKNSLWVVQHLVNFQDSGRMPPQKFCTLSRVIFPHEIILGRFDT